uniref:DNA polymerase delta interacting protein 3 n=1 Tax=Tetraodon nigroviridis TaxID=99883 RepID=H3CZT5_TETNG
MADISLDEVIRRRGINLKAPALLSSSPLYANVSLTIVSVEPAFGRGAGGMAKSFDARQKIGVNDVRQRLGVKDAREKLGQKDARFKIRGRGAVGGVQDARQMINSRKQGGAGIAQLGNKRMLDARDRLSLKRSIGGIQAQASAPPLKITKTIQNQVDVLTELFTAASARDDGWDTCSYTEVFYFFQPLSDERDGISSNQLKVASARSLLQSRAGSTGSTFSMSTPITKVVKNDAYTAPRPPVPVAPTRPNTSMAATRTLKQTTAEASRKAPTAPQPTFSPLEGTKITVNNLHPRVTEEDIVELFCVCGALKRARLVRVGVAEVVFVRKEDAVSAYRKYNNRCLDGQPMKCNLHIQGSVITSDQPILLRLSDTPGTSNGTKKDGLPSSSRPASQRASSQPTPEVDPQTILKALFKSTAQPTSTTEPPSSQATAFRIKI